MGKILLISCYHNNKKYTFPRDVELFDLKKSVTINWSYRDEHVEEAIELFNDYNYVVQKTTHNCIRFIHISRKDHNLALIVFFQILFRLLWPIWKLLGA